MLLLTCHLLIAVLEFFAINWLGRHSISAGYQRISFIQTVEDAPLFDFAFRVLAPTIFLAVSAALLYALNWDGLVRDYWRVTLLYFGVRWTYNVLMSRARLINWRKQGLITLIAVALSFVVSEQLLIHRSVVLPSARGLSDEFWIVIIGFLYVTAGRVRWPTLGPSAEERKQAYLKERYNYFRRRFGSVVSQHASSAMAEVLSYAVMIYESFNRPSAYQLIENLVLFPIGVANTLGPMQVTTSLRLPADEMVKLGVEHVNSALESALAEMKREQPQGLSVYIRRDHDGGYEIPYDESFDLNRITFEKIPSYYQLELVQKAAAKYNIRSDYPEEVAGVFGFLRDNYYSALNPELRSALFDDEQPGR